MIARHPASTITVHPISDDVPGSFLFFHTTDAIKSDAAHDNITNPVVFAWDVTGNAFIVYPTRTFYSSILLTHPEHTNKTDPPNIIATFC